MNETNFEFTDQDREVILRGLRFVRSSIMLETRDPTPDDEAKRGEKLRDIADMVERLKGSQSVAAVNA